jgi:folate-binding protein YgfZ
MISNQQLDSVRRGAGLADVLDRGRLVVTGADRAAYLHGLLSNDVLALGPGQGCYATYLTPQGRMICDLSVLNLGDRLLLDLPGRLKDAVLAKLQQFVFAEDVEIRDETESLGAIDLHGAEAGAVLARACGGDPEGFSDLGEYAHRAVEIAGHHVTVSGSRDVGLPGFRLSAGADAILALGQALERHGAVRVQPAILHVLRVEAGRPVFGIDMDETTIPLEAGIEDRAISMTKGCYVGQEVIVRVLHRGQGRVARRLVGLVVSAGDATQATEGDLLEVDGTDIGRLTSVARSPRFGVIALGYVRRDLAEPGVAVVVRHGGARFDATVVALPFGAPA